MFDIDGSHIAKLNYTDLRTLVARLCEADLRRVGLPVSSVTAGGDQNAADGGLDVRVDVPSSANISGFIPRPTTGFQVKVPDMPASAILEEMCPKGEVRAVIQELASNSGAYIIVSAQGSTADSALQRRRTAMRKAVAAAHNADSLALDFYDRERIASWVREHPGLVAWVRKKIGEPMRGWQPYGDWSKSNETANSKYLLDGKCRLHDWQSQREGGLPVQQGIQRLRKVLNTPRGVVRLVGLSGTGKTRLVQALFDDRVGEQALDPTLAHYTDWADEPEPSPRDVMRRLVQNRQRAIVIVDNCRPDTHRSLTAICREVESALGLITVEYDVADDEPEGTEVFRLEPASEDVIEWLLERRAPQVSQVDRRRIAELSGGNARMALALAHTVRQGESIANLTDKVLFERLFHQRHSPDNSLFRAAEVCSLVYSFNGEVLEGEAAELPLLAELAGITVDELYRCVTELHKRDLVQRRGSWRAVLPQALALWLARRALESKPPGKIEATMQKDPSGRLLRSFSRRLGFLHDCEAAEKIVRGWLSVGGLVSDLGQLNRLGIDLFRNIAPVAPDLIWESLERAVSRESGSGLIHVSGSGRSTWISLLSSLAYDPGLFQRAAMLLARFATAEPQSHKHDSARPPFKQLFQLYLSGTHASIEQRLQVIEILIANDDDASQSLAMDALSELLEACHFSAVSLFEFGARPRDYGWHPKMGSEVATWYRAAIAFAQRLALSNNTLAIKARSILAEKFRGMWNYAGADDELEAMARALAAQRFWPEGWIAVRATISFHVKEMLPEKAARLRSLEKVLRPIDLLQKAHAYLFSRNRKALDIGDGEEDDDGGDQVSAHHRVERITEGLGREIATRGEVLDVLPG